MKNDRTSRSKGPSIPKVVASAGKANTALDLFSVRQSFAKARGGKFDKDKELSAAEAEDAAWEQACKIPESSSDLMVMTATKKLGAYIVAVTQKSPAKFRGVFVNRMTNLCLDALQDMMRANSVRQDCEENRRRREDCQASAIIRLKMLGYIALLSENAGCLLSRQLRQISAQLANAINLAAAWKKSDNEKWRSMEKR